jgi:hypothetical protein
MARFCELAIGLRAPKLAAAGAKSPMVSGGYLKDSRFRETATGDRVRSGLDGGPRHKSQMVITIYTTRIWESQGFHFAWLRLDAEMECWGSTDSQYAHRPVFKPSRENDPAKQKGRHL